MSTKITKGLAAIALAGILGGGLAACGSSTGSASAPKPSTSAPAKANPSQDMAAWLASGGADAMNSIARCMSTMGDNPTQQQIATLSAAIAKAQSRPMPSSVDLKGAYPSLLKHYTEVVAAYQSGDDAAAVSAASAITSDTKTLLSEMKAVGVDASPWLRSG